MFGPWLNITIFFGSLIASISDLKTKEVPNYLSGFLIGLGLVLPWITALDQGSLLPVIKTYGLGGAALSFGYLMFKTSTWGGGDTKLMTAAALLISQLENGLLIFPMFLLMLFATGAVIGILYLFSMVFNNWDKLVKELRKERKEFIGFFIGALLLALIPFLFKLDLLMTGMFEILAILFLLIKPLKILEEKSLKTEKKVEDLVEGDWVIEKIEINGEALYSPEKNSCIDKETIQKLKQEGIEKVRVKKGLPFVPSFFIAFSITWFLSKNQMFLFFKA